MLTVFCQHAASKGFAGGLRTAAHLATLQSTEQLYGPRWALSLHSCSSPKLVLAQTPWNTSRPMDAVAVAGCRPCAYSCSMQILVARNRFHYLVLAVLIRVSFSPCECFHLVVGIGTGAPTHQKCANEYSSHEAMNSTQLFVDCRVCSATHSSDQAQGSSASAKR